MRNSMASILDVQNPSLHQSTVLEAGTAFVGCHRTVEMLSLILLFGVCFPHWTTGIEIDRDYLMINITEKDGNKNSLVRAITVFGLDNGKAINLSALDLDMIENGALSGLRGAKTLNLEYNRLEDLNLSLFSNLPNLKKISVAHNFITKFNGELVGSPKLNHLNLSYNRITDLKESNLVGLPKPVELILGKARLWQLGDKQDFFRKLDALFPRYVPMRAAMIAQREASIEHRIEDWFTGIELCRIDYESDFIESVRLLPRNTSSNCRFVKMINKSSALRVESVLNAKFRRGWYQVPEKFTILYFPSGVIEEVTPNLLNDLPESIEMVILGSAKTIKKNVIENRFLRVLKAHVNIEAGALEKTNLYSIDLSDFLSDNLDFVETLPTSVKQLILNNKGISEIPENLLTNLKALEHFEIESNSLTHLPTGLFRGLTELRCVNIKRNHLQSIEPRIFDDNRKLIIFDASFNSIRKIEDGVLKNTERLEEIDLSNNEITKIFQHTFSGLENGHLSSIKLRYNRIDIIEEGSFTNMTIDHLDLSANPLWKTSIAEGAFKSCQLGELLLPDYLDVSKIEYTPIKWYSDFYGIKLQYLTKGLYNATIEDRPFAITIPE